MIEITEGTVSNSSIGKWILTDDDCCQYVKQINEGKTQFEAYQILRLNDDDNGCEVIHGYIDFDDYDIHSREFYHDYLMPYGYESLGDVLRIYGEDFEQVLAEIIFETEIFDSLRVCNGTYEQCANYIRTAMEL